MIPTLDMIESRLMLGQHQIARRLLAEFGFQQECDERLRVCLELTRRIESSETFAKHAQFSQALAELRIVETLRPAWRVIDEFESRIVDLQSRFEAEIASKEAAERAGNWAAAELAAERARQLCPKCGISAVVRRETIHSARGSIAQRVESHHTQAWHAKVGSRSKLAVSSDSGMEPKPARFMLWIDGVGGYLCCLSGVVTIGQSIPGSHIDIPLQADISRRHAIVRRVGEGYAIDPLHNLKVNNRAVTEPAYLLNEDEITVGEKVRLRFVRRHSLSATARLDFVSRHRTNPTADGVLLMADSLILGPSPTSHVVCRDWATDVVIFRRPDGQLACRSAAPLQIDGIPVSGKPLLPFGAHLSGEGFSITLERLD